ncbi:MAG TPA: GGDEF domain-containing phosphodiesterase [Burkholderiales bacterium]|nr:GGDEF domain-containing phosphodiesterase [Burkholderiales bacterium]
MSGCSGGSASSRRSLDYAQFHQAVRSAVEQHCARTCAVLMVDVGELWRIDTSAGFAATDRLLREAKGRLADALPDRDFVGELGRYHLGCLLTDVRSTEHALLAASKVIRALAEPFGVENHLMYLSARAGVALADANCRSGEELLRRAAHALAEARARRQGAALYDPSADPSTLAQLELLGDFTRAIENNELFLCYQPKINLATGAMAGAEALLRWEHPRKGMIPPFRLIQIAEYTGLIAKLTQWVINTALREFATCRAGGNDLGVSINFSAQNLRETDIVEVVSQAVALWAVPADRIVIELTETAVMENEPLAQDALLRLKALGLELSMDDFGTGYSSMSRLRDMPLDELKIDMSFVRNMLEAPVHERIVQSMVGLAHSLNLRAVAEGVENREILERLKALGCDCAQGYYLGRPMRMEEFMRCVSGFPVSAAHSANRPGSTAGRKP